MEKEKLTQKVFDGQPDGVDWAGVDYDGTLRFGVATNPRFTWASEQWRGFTQIGEPVLNTNYEPLSSLHRQISIVGDHLKSKLH